MVIIQLAGGLGNQMFQYALHLQLKALGREVKIDDVTGFVGDSQRKPALAPFGIEYERPTKKELQKMLDSSLLPWHRLRRKLFGRQRKSYFEESKRFDPKIFAWDDICLEGYWQSEQYFRGAAEQVREAFDTDRLSSWLREQPGWQTLECLLQEINNMCSVSLHIRRGDYLTAENQALFGGICTEDYYSEAIRRMRERHPGCHFFLFSSDKNWAGQAYGAREDFTPVELPGLGGDAADYAEFLLMSRCRCHILANSSFGWWASYLNRNPDKTVFAPPRWLNGTDCRDFYRADMERVVVL